MTTSRPRSSGPDAEIFASALALPVVVAPMFLVSGVELVVAACRAGVIGTFPALNARSSEAFRAMLEAISERLAAATPAPRAAQPPPDAPHGVNLIVHRSNEPRLTADLEICVERRVPIVITSLGNPSRVVERVHAYGGLVFADVVDLTFARKAADAGVDGLVLVCAGAGGHAGELNPLAFVPAVRRFFDGLLLVAGGISTGAAVAATRALGADLAYMGTRFIPTPESRAAPAYRRMTVDASAGDVVRTAAVCDLPASFLVPSLERWGYVREEGGGWSAPRSGPVGAAWKDVWSAGQGVALIDRVEPVADVVARLAAEYEAVLRRTP